MREMEGEEAERGEVEEEEGQQELPPRPKSNLERAREYRRGLEQEMARLPSQDKSGSFRQRLKTPMFVDFSAKENRLLNRTAGSKEYRRLGPLDMEIIPRGLSKADSVSKVCMQTNSDLSGLGLLGGVGGGGGDS